VVELPDTRRRFPTRQVLRRFNLTSTVILIVVIVAAVVAESAAQARDAADLIGVDYEELKPIAEYENAAGTDVVHPGFESNVAGSAASPDDPSVEEAFASAARVVRRRFRQQRQAHVPMETRGVVASWNAHREMLEIWMSTQSPHEIRLLCSRITGLSENQVRVISGDVGGGFGLKIFLSREEVPTTFQEQNRVVQPGPIK